MICRYATTIVCSCPVDEGFDRYEAVFENHSMIRVEDINSAIGVFTGQKVFQESMTMQLARKLNCKVTTTGMHSGVLTTVVAP